MAENVFSSIVKEYTDRYFLINGRRPGVFVRTFGCQQNEADSEILTGIAVELGYEKADSENGAELVIFNTCAVREHAELKALSITGQLKHLKNANPDMIIAVCGCMVAQEHRLNTIRQSYPYVDIIFGTASHSRLPEYLSGVIRDRERIFSPDDSYEIEEGLPVKRESDFKAWVSIMYGCDNFCTYCVVPYVRGRERSRRREDILSEVRTLVSEGVKEITLLGQNVNSYGKTLYDNYDFADLLTDICKIEGDYIIRFMTSHPKDATKKLVDVMAANSTDQSRPRIARSFHLPLQSGSDDILKKMNRHYSTEKYLSFVSYLRDKIPDIAISTDIIVGFPTETEEDFEKTLEMLNKVRYDAFFSFIYSIRQGTPAAKMEQVPDKVKSERFSRMLDLQNSISLEKNALYVGNTERVLVEGISKTDSDMLTGRNEKNRLVHFKGKECLIGSFAYVKITRADTYCLTGELVKEET